MRCGGRQVNWTKGEDGIVGREEKEKKRKEVRMNGGEESREFQKKHKIDFIWGKINTNRHKKKRDFPLLPSLLFLSLTASVWFAFCFYLPSSSSFLPPRAMVEWTSTRLTSLERKKQGKRQDVENGRGGEGREGRQCLAW